MGDIGIIADVAFLARMSVAPLFGGRAEERRVQDIGFGSVNDVDLLFGQLRRDEVLFNGVGMNSVVDFGQIAADIPAELLSLLFLEPLKLFDEVKFELW